MLLGATKLKKHFCGKYYKNKVNFYTYRRMYNMKEKYRKKSLVRRTRKCKNSRK